MHYSKPRLRTKIVAFWGVSPCGFVGENKSLGEHAGSIFGVEVTMFMNTLVTYASRKEGVHVTLGEGVKVSRTGAYTLGNVD
jgi:hypothetical protein